MFRSRRMAWVLGIVAAVVLFGTALEAAETGLKIGIVDTTKVMDSPRVKQYIEEIKSFEQMLQIKYTLRSQMLMLADDEIKEYIDLKIKDNPTDADKARIKALEDSEKARDAELKTLQEKKDATDQEKARLKELQDMRQKSKDTGDALAKDYQAQDQAKLEEIDGKIMADVKEAVAKVAEAKGLTLVLRKEATIYGGVDISDDVVQKLDRKIK